MKIRNLFLGLALGLAAAQPYAAETSSKPLAALADRYLDAKARFDPLIATFSGDNRFDGELAITISPAERKKRFAMYRDVQRRLKAIDRARLARADMVTYDLLAYDLAANLAFELFDDHLLPVNQMDSVPTTLANFGGGQGPQPLKTVVDYEKYLRRLSRLPEWIDQAIANMREGVRRGIVQPRAIIESTLPQIRALASGDPQASPFYMPAKNFPAGFSEADRARLSEAYRDLVAKRLIPSHRKLADFLEKEYLPAGRATSGWGALPNGAQWYRVYVHDQTTTDLDPDAIHEIGLKEVARIQAELARLAPRLGYAGEPSQFLAWLRANGEFRPFRTEGEILDAYRAIDAKVKAKLPDLFGVVPKAALEIRPEPELTRASASDHYTSPAADGSRPGVFWAVIVDPAKYATTGMTSLFLHEGEPGHHFQLALQQEMALPKFRRFWWINSYGEGWALYTETLGKEMGLYDDPNAYAGQLRGELFRAARLVVDTGLHAKGWTRERAMAYLQDNAGSNEAGAKNQIERYMSWPAQALGYKIGSLKIMELRSRASQALGPKFRLAAFHDAVLRDGSVPLSVLEARIDRWIAEQAMQ